MYTTCMSGAPWVEKKKAVDPLDLELWMTVFWVLNPSLLQDHPVVLAAI